MSEDLKKGSIFTQVQECIANLKMEYNTEYNVVFLTSVGKVVCDIGAPGNANSLIGLSDDPSEISVDISSLFDGSHLFETDLVNAKNVTVYKNSTLEKFMQAEQMILFADQILGFTIEKK